jgi:uncharacterized membrane protein
MVSLANIGSQAGTVIAMPLTGWLCSFNGGWPSPFYIFGKFVNVEVQCVCVIILLNVFYQ